jgi:hypothetical protein
MAHFYGDTNVSSNSVAPHIVPRANTNSVNPAHVNSYHLASAPFPKPPPRPPPGVGTSFLSQQRWEEGALQHSILSGLELDPMKQKLLLQQLGIDPTPRRETQPTQPSASLTDRAYVNGGHDVKQTPSQSMQQVASASKPSNLLERIQDFLPKIEAANSAMTTNRIDTSLVEANSVDDESVDSDTNGPVSSLEEAKTIQFDLTLGVDANHPVMTMLDSAGREEKDFNGETHSTNEEDVSLKDASKRTVGQLFRVPSTVSKATKGPLITEIASEDV